MKKVFKFIIISLFSLFAFIMLLSLVMVSCSKEDNTTVEFVGYDLGENNTIVIFCNFTNNSDEDKSFNDYFDVLVSQNGIKCEKSGMGVNTSEKVAQGETVSVTLSYKLENDISDVKLTIKKNNTTKLSETFSIN